MKVSFIVKAFNAKKSLYNTKQICQGPLQLDSFRNLTPLKKHPIFPKTTYIYRYSPNTKIPDNLTLFRVSRLGMKLRGYTTDVIFTITVFYSKGLTGSNDSVPSKFTY